MNFTAWLRNLGVSNLGRLGFRRSRSENDRTIQLPAVELDLDDLAVQVFPGSHPDPVAWTPVGAVGTVDQVGVFLFDHRPDGLAPAGPVGSGGSGEPSDGYEGTPPPNGTPLESLLSRLWRVLAAPCLSLMPGPDSVIEWPGELMPFQLEGVKALVDSRQFLLADDMGLGKTLQVIAALRILLLKGEIQTVLVIAPASVLDQWRRELLKWDPDLRAMVIRGSVADRGWQWATPVHVALVSYDTLRSDFSEGSMSPVARRTWDVVVADEAQRIKNRNSTSDAVKGLKRRRSWALTGTPVENDEEELASIMEFVDHDESEGPKRYTAGAALRQRHREVQLRRKKADVLADLPPKITAKVPIELGSAQRLSYDRAEREGVVHLRKLGRDVRVQHVLELISRLKQICNAELATGESSKFEDIRGRIETLAAQENRVLVFSQYTRSGFGVEAVAEALRDFEPLTFTGAQSQEERRDIISRFRRDDWHKVLVVSLRAGGVGLNLQEASYVFHLDRWWNPAVERQAEDRSHRYGQTVPVHVFKYSCVNTIEERIDHILERKQELFDELVDDVSIDLSTVLTSRELFGLFGLEEPPGAGRKGGP